MGLMRGWTAALLVVGLIGVLGVAFGGRLSESLGEDDLLRLAYLALLASFVGAGLFTGGWRSLRSDLRALLFWAAALVAVAGAYALRHDMLAFGQRVAAALVPGMIVDQGGAVVVTRGQDGMFVVEGEVNGAKVRFIFDTGASGLSLTAEDARRAGISTTEADYTVTTSTANGLAKVAPVLIERVAVGSIAFSRIPATISKPGALRRSLLGHAFLDRLASYEVRGDQLILRRR